MRSSASRLIQRYGLLAMWAVMLLVFAALNRRFLTPANFLNILEQNAALAVVAIGITFAVIGRNLDLSPGSMIALTGVVMGLVFRATGSGALTVTAGLAAALAAGMLNGLLVVQFDLNPVIVTLAAYIWMRGLAMGLAEANSIGINAPFVSFMNSLRPLGLPVPVWLIVICYLAGWVLLEKTRLGRYTRALGGDETATRHAGINTGLYRMLIFGLTGALVGVASLITVSRLASAQPNAAFGLELDAIAAVIIGGNRLTGGEGNLRRTALGVLLIAVLNNGLSGLGMRDAYFFFFKGLVILLALFIQTTSHRLVRQTGTYLPAKLADQHSTQGKWM